MRRAPLVQDRFPRCFVAALFFIWLAFFQVAGAARAADTIEPFDLGLSDAELYAGSLADEKSLQIEAVLGVGLTEQLSLFVLRGFKVADSEAKTAGVLEVGLFYNMLDLKRLELDVIAALGFGLPISMSSRRICLGTELNLDWDRFGLYSRLIGSVDEEYEGSLKPCLSSLLGVRFFASELSELLMEIAANPSPDGLDEVSVAMGFNIAPAAWLELIPEIAYLAFPGEEKGAFRLLLGAIFTF